MYFTAITQQTVITELKFAHNYFFKILVGKNIVNVHTAVINFFLICY